MHLLLSSILCCEKLFNIPQSIPFGSFKIRVAKGVNNYDHCGHNCGND
jgi:hypothetical protein